MIPSFSKGKPQSSRLRFSGRWNAKARAQRGALGYAPYPKMCIRDSRQANLSKLTEEIPSEMDLDQVDMDDMEVPLGGDDEIPERELEEIDRELSGDMDDEDQEEEDPFSDDE